MQELAVLFLFLVALVMIGHSFYKTFNQKKGCAKGCGSCSAIDITKIEAEISKKLVQDSKG
jgi:hypothetical protein